MKQTIRSEILQQSKLSFYWGILSGIACGLVLATRETWFLNQYIQKAMTYVTLEVFSEKLVLCVVAATVAFLTFFPLLTIIARKLLHISNPPLLRFVLMVSGIVWISVGYYVNKTSWFPPFDSVAGVLGNEVITAGCLGLLIWLYRKLSDSPRRLGSTFDAPFSRLFNSAVFVTLALFFLGFNGYAYLKLKNHSPSGPNVVLLSIDTVRADHLGCYGYGRDTSPTIDGLAERGVLFSQVYAQRGLTWPSLTSIMTSMYPKSHGVRENGVALNAAYITLPEMLKNAGYKTGAFLANYQLAPNRGFDEKTSGGDAKVTDAALEWLGKIDPTTEKFFLWLHLYEPHAPYRPKNFNDLFDPGYEGEYDGTWAKLDQIYFDKIDLREEDLDHIVSLYDEEIRSADAQLGRIVEKLSEMGTDKETLIVFTADHGEELYDHNYYFYHGCSIYDGVLRIPLIFYWPDVVPGGPARDNQLESIDIAPTILELLKLPLHEQFEGRSVLPLLFGNAGEEWHPVYAEQTTGIFALRTPKWKYIYNPENEPVICLAVRDNPGAPFVIETNELYDVQEDPLERNNLAAEYPEIIEDYQGRIAEWIRTNLREHEDVELSEEAIERLRTLGYIN